MPHPCNAESVPPADSEQIVACIRRILTHVENLKPQIVRFHQFICVDVLKQEINILSNLLRTDAVQPAIRSSNKPDRQPVAIAGAVQLNRAPHLTSNVPQDTIDQVLKFKTLQRRPIIYMTPLESSEVMAKINKHCKQPKIRKGEPVLTNPNDLAQMQLSPYGLRESIFIVTKLLCLLEHTMKLFLATQTDTKPSTEAVPSKEDTTTTSSSTTTTNTTTTVTTSANLLLSMHQVRRFMNRISEAVERINNRRYLDRILIHLRRRSTAKSMMYMIDQEKNRKSPWRI